MKKLAKLIAAITLSVIVLSAFAGEAHAQTQTNTNEQTSTTTVNCTTGSYGQSNNCYAITNQTITNDNRILGIRNTRNVARHYVVDTAVNQSAMLGALIAMIGSAVLGYFVVKNRA